MQDNNMKFAFLLNTEHAQKIQIGKQMCLVIFWRKIGSNNQDINPGIQQYVEGIKFCHHYRYIISCNVFTYNILNYCMEEYPEELPKTKKTISQFPTHNSLPKHHYSLNEEDPSTRRSRQRQGGLSSVPMSSIFNYFRHLTLCRETSQNLTWLDSVKDFSKMINSDPILRMNWEYGIYQCKKTLPGKTGNDVLDMIDTAVKTPPAFSNSDLVGFPINVIFIEFMQNQNGRNFFSHRKVNDALKLILKDYDDMIKSPASLKYMDQKAPHGWLSPEAWKQIDYNIYACDISLPYYGFKSWNEWFLRLFKENVRPIGAGSPTGTLADNCIINACQSTPLQFPKQPIFNVKLIDNFWLKDDVYSLQDMFGAERYDKNHHAHHFQGGTIYQAFLSALFYHRWNSPVDGYIEDIYTIDGTYYVDQSQFIPYDEGSPNNSESFLSAVAARQVFVIRSDNDKIGKIALIFIGMAQVSSCVATVKQGDRVLKGQQLGHFAYGGSSHVVVFQKKVKLNFAQTLYRTDSNCLIKPQKQNVHSFLAEVV